MALILKMLWDYRKVLAYAALLVTLALLAWRVSVWRDAFQRLPEIEAQVSAERNCTLESECHKRAAKLAEQARLEAEAKAQDALEAAEKAEAKARANAAEWKRRYEAAKRDDPDCSDWARRPIQCPL